MHEKAISGGTVPPSQDAPIVPFRHKMHEKAIDDYMLYFVL
jgi:hypothetical protein